MTGIYTAGFGPQPNKATIVGMSAVSVTPDRISLEAGQRFMTPSRPSI